MNKGSASLLWAAGAAPTLLVDINDYADPTASQLADLNRTLELVVEFTESRGGLKALVGADLNATLGQLVVDPWLAVCGWKDLHHQVTCVATRSLVPRRIDVLVASAANLLGL